MRIEERFREVVRQYPSRVAVRYGNAEMTYAELDRESDTLATSPMNSIVPNPLWAINAMAGWKAQIPVWLEGRAAPVVKQISPDVAYLESTSGTTGAGKTVMISHAAAIAQADTDISDLGIGPQTRTGSHRWGMAAWRQMLLTLLGGGTLCVFPGPKNVSLRVWVNEQGITYFPTLATTYRWLVQGIFTFPSVKVVDVGGEMVRWGDVELYKLCFPNGSFINRFTASEAQVICRKRVERDDPIGEGRMPVGKPVKGVKIWAGPSESKPDEIRVRSPYMAEGYYDDPELTAAKFRDGWYHTGDLGYWLPNGELMHCNRDFQGEVRDKFDAERYLHERNMASAMMGGEVK